MTNPYWRPGCIGDLWITPSEKFFDSSSFPPQAPESADDGPLITEKEFEGERITLGLPSAVHCFRILLYQIRSFGSSSFAQSTETPLPHFERPVSKSDTLAFQKSTSTGNWTATGVCRVRGRALYGHYFRNEEAFTDHMKSDAHVVSCVVFGLCSQCGHTNIWLWLVQAVISKPVVAQPGHHDDAEEKILAALRATWKNDLRKHKKVNFTVPPNYWIYPENLERPCPAPTVGPSRENAPRLTSGSTPLPTAGETAASNPDNEAERLPDNAPSNQDLRSEFDGLHIRCQVHDSEAEGKIRTV
jgi:hypothetical protein